MYIYIYIFIIVYLYIFTYANTQGVYKNSLLEVSLHLTCFYGPYGVTVSSPAGSWKFLMVYNPTKFGCYNANRIWDKAINVCHVT